MLRPHRVLFSLRFTWTLAALAGALSLASGSARCAAKKPIETVHVGVFTVAPYVFSGPGGPYGVLIDFFDAEIAPRMGVSFVWDSPVTIARLEQNLLSGRVMFTPIMTKSPARVQAGFKFAGEVDVQFKPCIALLPTHKLTAIREPADLYDMKIGWVKTSPISQFLQDERIRMDLIGVIDWERANLAKLEAGRLDGIYFSNPYTPQYYAAKTGLRLKLLDLPVPAHPVYATFAPAAPAALVARYESAARQAFANGRFEQYIERALVKKAY